MMPETLFSDAPTAAKVPPVDEPIMIRLVSNNTIRYIAFLIK